MSNCEHIAYKIPETSGTFSGLPGSELNAALALVDFGPRRCAERPQDWINVAGPMTAYCKQAEDVNLAAARIIAAEYRNLLKILKDPIAVHINMLHGTIAWTPEHLRHVLGDSNPNNSITRERSELGGCDGSTS